MPRQTPPASRRKPGNAGAPARQPRRSRGRPGADAPDLRPRLLDAALACYAANHLAHGFWPLLAIAAATAVCMSAIMPVIESLTMLHAARGQVDWASWLEIMFRRVRGLLPDKELER